ncbi:DUF7266 family protein [Methanolinea mesophila]
MRRRSGTGTSERADPESGVSPMVEYIIISGILLLLLVIVVPLVTTVFIDQPTNQLITYAFTDIGNGVSTRIVDLYAVVPFYNTATITTEFNIPDEVAGKDYRVDIVPGPPSRPYDSQILISGGNYQSEISLAGIGATVFGTAEGNTTASGVNEIYYHYP